MSFSMSEISAFKSFVDFAQENKFMDLKLSYKDGVFLNIKVTYEFAKKLKSTVKRVEEFEETGYPAAVFLDDGVLVFQFNKNCLSEQAVKMDKSYGLTKVFVEVKKNKLFVSLKEKMSFEKMKDLVQEEVETQLQEVEVDEQDEKYEKEEEQTIQDTVLDAEDEMWKMLENALGPMTSLLDKKFKQKMSRHAILKIIKSVVGVTLRTVDAETPENEKLVFSALDESGFTGKKEKRVGKLSGYTLFTKDMHRDKKEEFKSKGLKGSDVTKEIGAMWKKLSDDDKQEYNNRAKKENEENPSSSNKGSRKGSKKASNKGSKKSDKEVHKCCFVISKGDRKGEECGTSVRSEEPTFEGQWLCSKHTTAEKKKVESNKNKKEKGSKKSEKKINKKKDEDEEEVKSEKPEKKKVDKKKKKVEKDDDEEEVKSEKPKKKKVEKKKKVVDEEDDVEKEEVADEEKPKKDNEIADIDDIPDDVEEDGSEYAFLDEMCIEWEEDRENCLINATISKNSLEKLISKKLSDDKYEIKMSATKSSLIVKYEEDDEEEMKSIKMDKMTDDLKKVHRYINSMDEE